MNGSIQPKVSFIVPVYGVEAYLSQCLDSIAGQTLQEWECILVDDGSPDACGEICDSYVAADPRFKVIHKQNAGVSAARNDGIDKAVGAWAYFVDSDDWLELDAAERLYAAGEANHVDCVMSYSEKVYPDGHVVRSVQFRERFIARTREELDDIQKYVLYPPYSPYYTSETEVGYAAPWGKFVRLSILKENNIRFDPYLRGVFDDGLYSLYLLEACESLLYLHEKTYNYRVVATSLTHSFKPDAMDIQKRGYERIEEFLVLKDKDRSFWEAYFAHVVVFLGGYLSRYYFHPNNQKPRIGLESELKRDLESEPFGIASRLVDTSRLKPKDRFLAFCERNKLIAGLHVYVMVKRLVRGSR